MSERRPRIGITWGRTTPDYMPRLGWYVDRVREAGGDPVAVLPLARVGDAVAYIASRDTGLYQLHAGEGASARDFDGLVFAGGPDLDPRRYGDGPRTDTLDVDAARDAIEIPLMAAALDGGVPVFGICRGFQILNAIAGGKLVQDIPSLFPGAVEHQRGVAHPVDIVPGSRLQALAGCDRLTVNSWHHQGVAPGEDLAPGLTPTAFAPDGLIEAFEPQEGRFPGYVHAVQWHPERFADADAPEFRALTAALFADFLAAARRRARSGEPAAS